MAAPRELAAYAVRRDSDTIESLSKKLTADMRDNIKSLAMHAVLSEEWSATAERLTRIANISEMEKKIPKPAGSTTLWEGEELALRYLLEDGKLNLSLRLLDEYMAFLARCDGAHTHVTGEDALRCARFEFGAGVMLANAWTHKEAIQTTDLPLFARVIHAVLTRALSYPPVATGIAACATPAASPAATGHGGGGAGSPSATAMGDGDRPVSTGAMPVGSGCDGASSDPGGAGDGVTTTAVPQALPPGHSLPYPGAGMVGGMVPGVAGVGIPTPPTTTSTLSTPKRSLESIVLQFFVGAGKHAVGLYERRIVGELVKAGVFEAVALHLHANHGRLDPGDIAAGCEGLSMLVSTEEFATCKGRLFTAAGTAAAMASLRGDFLDKLMSSADAAGKRKFRLLVDLSAEIGRRPGVGIR